MVGYLILSYAFQAHYKWKGKGKMLYKATWSVISISAESRGLHLPRQFDKEGERIEVGRRLIFSKNNVAEVIPCN